MDYVKLAQEVHPQFVPVCRASGSIDVLVVYIMDRVPGITYHGENGSGRSYVRRVPTKTEYDTRPREVRPLCSMTMVHWFTSDKILRTIVATWPTQITGSDR